VQRLVGHRQVAQNKRTADGNGGPTALSRRGVIGSAPNPRMKRRISMVAMLEREPLVPFVSPVVVQATARGPWSGNACIVCNFMPAAFRRSRFQARRREDALSAAPEAPKDVGEETRPGGTLLLLYAALIRGASRASTSQTETSAEGLPSWTRF
jgi:hypothetical protein